MSPGHTVRISVRDSDSARGQIHRRLIVDLAPVIKAAQVAQYLLDRARYLLGWDRGDDLLKRRRQLAHARPRVLRCSRPRPGDVVLADHHVAEAGRLQPARELAGV